MYIYALKSVCTLSVKILGACAAGGAGATSNPRILTCGEYSQLRGCASETHAGGQIKATSKREICTDEYLSLSHNSTLRQLKKYNGRLELAETRAVMIPFNSGSGIGITVGG